MPAQEKLSRTEQILAYLIGGGIALAMLALFLYGISVVDTNYAVSILLVGLVLIVIGIGAWLYLLRPWNAFDDLTTPYYTGHAHVEHAEAEAEEEVAAVAEPAPAPEPVAEVVVEAVAEPAPEPVVEPEPVAEVVVEAVAEPAPEPVVEAEPVAEPAAEDAGEPDDLTLIEGIGRKSAEALATSGVRTFKTMAAMTPEALENAVKSQKVRLVGSTETWPMQAKLAAAGDLAALDELKGRIKGGILHDELTKIEGIGPKAQEALYNAGYRTFAAIAGADAAALRGVLEAADLKLLTPDTWAQQAELIVKGDLDGLKALQDQLKGGRA